MKRTLITLVFMLCLCLFLYAYQTAKQQQQPKQERTFQIVIPATLGQALIEIVKGDLNRVSASDFKAISETVTGQLLYQDRQYFLQDSTAAAAKDTTKQQKKKP